MSIGSVLKAGFQFPKGWGVWTSAGLGLVALGAVGGVAGYFIHKNQRSKSPGLRSSAASSSSSISPTMIDSETFNPRSKAKDLNFEGLLKDDIEFWIKRYEGDRNLGTLVAGLEHVQRSRKAGDDMKPLIEYVRAEQTKQL